MENKSTFYRLINLREIGNGSLRANVLYEGRQMKIWILKVGNEGGVTSSNLTRLKQQ